MAAMHTMLEAMNIISANKHLRLWSLALRLVASVAMRPAQTIVSFVD